MNANTQDLGCQSALWDIGFILSCVSFAVLVPYLNTWVLSILSHYGIVNGAFRNNVFIAAITEPWTSKLFGVAFFLLAGFVAVIAVALGILFLVLSAIFGLDGFTTLALAFGVPLFTGVLLRLHFDFRFRSVNLLRKRWKAAPLAGFLFGIFELYFRMLPEFTWLFWENPYFNPNLLGPVFLHIITGTIVVGAFLSSVWARSRMTGMFTLGAIVVASGIHFVWNTWLISPEGAPFWSWFYSAGSPIMHSLIVVCILAIGISLLRDALTALMYLSRR